MDTRADWIRHTNYRYYVDMNDPVEDAPASRFVNHFLQSAIQQGAEKIHLERRLKTFGKGGIFSIAIEVDGASVEIAMPPIVLWEQIVSQLKVMARMVDYGPNKTEVGEFTLLLSDGRTADIQLTSNPNPHTDTKVTLINKSIADIESDEYLKLKGAFLSAAMPSGQSELEHTFGMFLRKFAQTFEVRLVKRISNDGIIALRQASLDENNDRSGDRKKFADAMDLVAQQASINDFSAAANAISEAYEELYDSRRRRYEAILAGLTDIDRAAVKAEFLDKVTLSIEPSRSEPDRREVVLAIDFPGEKTRRIERRWSYYLANGTPMLRGDDFSHGDVISSSSNFSSRGD
jgi:hypothetical protein